jgi:hypothetical protein
MTRYGVDISRGPRAPGRQAGRHLAMDGTGHAWHPRSGEGRTLSGLLPKALFPRPPALPVTLTLSRVALTVLQLEVPLSVLPPEQ